MEISNLIDPLNPTVLKSYRGTLIENLGRIIDIEFESYHHATSWARTCEIESQCQVAFSNDNARLDCSVRITYYPGKG